MVALVLVVVAQAAPAWRLDWSAPDGCTSAATHVAAVERRLTQPVFSEVGARVLRGRVTRTEQGWLATLEALDGDVVLGQREVSAEGAACQALDARLTLVLALIIDPTQSLSTPSVAVVPAKAPVLPSRPAPAAPVLPQTPRVRLEVSSNVPVVIVEAHHGVDSGRHEAWEGRAPLCFSPCGVEVARGATLLVTGNDVIERTFTLGLARGEVARVTVKAASASRLIVSAVGLSLAAPLAVLSAVGLGVARDPTLGTVSIVGLVVGLGLTVLSIVGVAQGPTVVAVE